MIPSFVAVSSFSFYLLPMSIPHFTFLYTTPVFLFVVACVCVLVRLCVSDVVEVEAVRSTGAVMREKLDRSSPVRQPSNRH